MPQSFLNLTTFVQSRCYPATFRCDAICDPQPICLEIAQICETEVGAFVNIQTHSVKLSATTHMNLNGMVSSVHSLEGQAGR